MITAKFSNNLEAIRSRIRRLPKLMKKTLEVSSKKDALGLIETYRNGLSNNKFNLNRLHKFSIDQKKRKGYDKPNIPLYGAGDNLDRTLYNGLIVIKQKNKYIVKFSDKKHHEAELTINQLHQIHENGCIIVVTEKMRRFLHWMGLHLKKSTVMIRIPPRQAFAKAITQFMKSKKKEDKATAIKKAINTFLKTNSERQFNVIQQYDQEEKEILSTIGAE